jgi:hypothetical protein
MFHKTNNYQHSIIPFKQIKMVPFNFSGLMLMKKIKVKMFGFSEKFGNHRLTHLFHVLLKFWVCKDMFISIQVSLQNKVITFKGQ